MDLAAYLTFLGFALVVVLVPGADFAVVTGNAISGGRRRGTWSAVGVSCSNAVQGAAAVAGLGALVVSSQPLFQAIKWAGVAYLAWLGVRMLRSAVRGVYPSPAAVDSTPGAAFHGWRQGFLSNITNPKVLVFYLAVVPQFLTPGTTRAFLLLLALSHALISLAYLLLLVAVLHRARALLAKRPVRRTLDAMSGTAMLAFSARIATERA